jgi:glycosyltransferase involved in cell wall biosynthesis
VNDVRIVYLHQYFAVPHAAGSAGRVTGTRSYEFARRLAQSGHQVHMVCSDWINPAGSKRGHDWRTETIDGIEVHALPLYYSNQMGIAERLGVFASFAWRSLRKATKLGGDVVFATSTPLTIAIPGIYSSFVNRVPLVFEVRDLWPEAPRQMGVLTNPLIFGLARGLELAAYRKARYVVALSPGMRDGVIAAGVPPDQVVMIPNSCDLDLFHPGVNGQAFRKKLDLGDRLALLYFGTMGPANGLDFVLDGAAELKRRGEDRAVIVLHGEGKMRPHLQARKVAESLNNVIFSDPVGDKSKVAEIVAASDVTMTIYKNLPVLHTCSPNKMFDSFAAARPVLTNMPGWLGELVERNGSGVFVEPDRPGDFADKVQGLLARRDELPEMGRRARALAEREFSRDRLAGQLEQLLVKAAGFS